MVVCHCWGLFPLKTPKPSRGGGGGRGHGSLWLWLSRLVRWVIWGGSGWSRWSHSWRSRGGRGPIVVQFGPDATPASPPLVYQGTCLPTLLQSRRSLIPPLVVRSPRVIWYWIWKCPTPLRGFSFNQTALFRDNKNQPQFLLILYFYFGPGEGNFKGWPFATPKKLTEKNKINQKNKKIKSKKHNKIKSVLTENCKTCKEAPGYGFLFRLLKKQPPNAGPFARANLSKFLNHQAQRPVQIWNRTLSMSCATKPA